MELNREHIRAIIYYNWKRGLTRSECDEEMSRVLGETDSHLAIIKRWYNEFERGRLSLEDEPYTGRTLSSTFD
jgi:histone-lysine N-methyltransferase SETMAR